VHCILLCRRSSRCPPPRDIVDIACEAQERVESTIPRPPVGSRNASFSSLQQVVPDTSNGGTAVIELLPGTTASQLQKVHKLNRTLLRSTGGQNELRPVAVFYRNVNSASESDEEHSGIQCSQEPVASDGKAEGSTGSSEANDRTSAEQCATSVDLMQFDSQMVNVASLECSVAKLSAVTNGPNVSGDVDPSLQSESMSAVAKGSTPAIVLDEVVDTHTHPPLIRLQSLLKMSHSESSLAASASSLNVAPVTTLTTSSAEDLTYNTDDDFDVVESGGADHTGTGFARLLRGKMAAALAAPRAATAGPMAAATRRRQLEELAKNRLNKSKLQFKGCQTRVVLL